MLRESSLESARFGFKMGRLEVTDEAELREGLKRAAQEKFDFVNCRVETKKILFAQSLEKRGFILTDTLMYYQKRIAPLASMAKKNWISISEQGELSGQIVDVAKRAFKNYPNHFKFDERLDAQASDAIYPDWARRCCEDRNVADDVLVSRDGDEVTGFIALKIKDGAADVLLAAVNPGHQGRGLFRQLLADACSWAESRGCERITYSTQLVNLNPQKALVREGFELYQSYYTFHLWL